MYDRYNRRINYLRISVTDRCNLRCRYCMPAEGIRLISHHDILSFEEILDVAGYAVTKGIDKIRITGGEPLVRKGIVHFVERLSKISGIKDLSMTTNGILLSEYAHNLKNAGLQRVNVSLDTLDPEKYTHLTRGGDIRQVLKGIDAAIHAGLNPVKVNCVVEKNSSEPDAREVASYAAKKNLEVRFIHQMSLNSGSFSIVEGGEGGNCKKCNRIRLTANGLLKPCLFSDIGYDVRKLGIEKAWDRALENKPESGTKNHTNLFYNIGG